MADTVVLPYPWTAACALVDFGNDLIPPLGGAAQRPCKLGARFKVTFSSLPALPIGAARTILAQRAKARANAATLIFSWPQPGASAFGSPVVNGANQLGASLVCSGFTASVTIPIGTFFSFAAGGRVNLAATTAAVTASGGGAATLSIAPMLRASPASGAALSFAAPQIEGFVQGVSEDWTLERLLWTGLPSFTVMEAA